MQGIQFRRFSGFYWTRSFTCLIFCFVQWTTHTECILHYKQCIYIHIETFALEDMDGKCSIVCAASVVWVVRLLFFFPLQISIHWNNVINTKSQFYASIEWIIEVDMIEAKPKIHQFGCYWMRWSDNLDRPNLLYKVTPLLTSGNIAQNEISKVLIIRRSSFASNMYLIIDDEFSHIYTLIAAKNFNIAIHTLKSICELITNTNKYVGQFAPYDDDDKNSTQHSTLLMISPIDKSIHDRRFGFFPVSRW